jgi:hypothetical protein
MKESKKRGGVRAYARWRHVSPAAVMRAIRSGRIVRDAAGLIDFRQADRDWQANSRARATQVAAPRRSSPAAPIPDEEEGSAQYARARAVREFFQASLARIEYEERVGKLVSRDEIQATAFNTYRVYRERLLNIPDRVAAIFAAEAASGLTAELCHRILDPEIHRALNDLVPV